MAEHQPFASVFAGQLPVSPAETVFESSPSSVCLAGPLSPGSSAGLSLEDHPSTPLLPSSCRKTWPIHGNFKIGGSCAEHFIQS